MVDGSLVVLAGEHWRQERRVDPPALGEEVDKLPRGGGLRIVLAGGVQLDAVAGGEEDPLAAGKTLPETAQRYGGLFGGESQPFPQLHRHRAVRSPHKGERHRITPGRGVGAVGRATVSIICSAAGIGSGPVCRGGTP